MHEKQRELQVKLGDKFHIIKRLNLSIVDIPKDEKTPSCFRKKYDSLTKDDRENSLLKEMKKTERKIKYFPFGKSENQAHLDVITSLLEGIQEAKSKAEEFESLSVQDKKEIEEYLRLSNKSNNLNCKISSMKRDIRPITGDHIKVENDRCDRTLDRMLNEGRISEKDLDEIFKKLNNVEIKESNGQYKDCFIFYDKDYSKVQKYFKIMKWFVVNVYKNREKLLDRNIEEVKTEDLGKETIQPLNAFKSVLKDISTEDSKKADNVEKSELNHYNIIEGEIIDD